MSEKSSTFRLGPLAIERTTAARLAARVQAQLAGNRAPVAVAFCNAHTAKLALDDPPFARILSKMIVVNDGLGIQIASRLLTGERFAENLNGTDFIPFFLGWAQRPLRIYLLGGRHDTVERAARTLSDRFARHTIVGFRDGYFDRDALDDVVAQIRETKADIVLCAMGNPLQEQVASILVERGAAPLCFCVGALFDFISGEKPRAPKLVRAVRAEFLFRLALEPRRLFMRYTIEAGSFLVAVVRMRLHQGFMRRQPTG